MMHFVPQGLQHFSRLCPQKDITFLLVRFLQGLSMSALPQYRAVSYSIHIQDHILTIYVKASCFLAAVFCNAVICGKYIIEMHPDTWLKSSIVSKEPLWMDSWGHISLCLSNQWRRTASHCQPYSVCFWKMMSTVQLFTIITVGCFGQMEAVWFP